MSTSESFESISRTDSQIEMDKDLEQRVRAWLGKKYEIHLTDGRKIRGTLTCVDKDGNLILFRSDERWPDSEDSRWIGQAMIPKRHISSIYVLKTPQETRI